MSLLVEAAAFWSAMLVLGVAGAPVVEVAACGAEAFWSTVVVVLLVLGVVAALEDAAIPVELLEAELDPVAAELSKLLAAGVVVVAVVVEVVVEAGAVEL